jgi:two-component system sensor histidine kinase KdpD
LVRSFVLCALFALALVVTGFAWFAPAALHAAPRLLEIGLPLLFVLLAGALVLVDAGVQRAAMTASAKALEEEQDRTFQLQEADRVKNTFLAAVNHELRTPLTSILGFSLTLLDRGAELDAAQRTMMLNTVVTEAEHLEDLLADLLDLDRLTRGRSTLLLGPVDPGRLVEVAVARTERRTGRDVGLTVERGAQVSLDAAKVQRIVENLVGNASKYTPADAPINVSMRYVGSGIEIRVDDGGPGIPEELHAVVFEPFYRVHDTHAPGTGIGLSLVDQFSRLHGGRAWVQPCADGGCSFRVQLPSVTQPRAAPGAPRGAVAPSVVGQLVNRAD